jgi:hypothetical protein
MDFNASGRIRRTRRPSDLQSRRSPVFNRTGPRISIRNANLVPQDFSVARDKIVFNQGQITGNIWIRRSDDRVLVSCRVRALSAVPVGDQLAGPGR